MHGANDGIGLTDNCYITWQQLREYLFQHNIIKGFDPFICMASCNGIQGHSMADAHRSAFNYLIGNEGAVYQSDVTVAYLSFYNHIFHKQASIEQAVEAMKVASGDTRFFYAIGGQLKNRRFAELNTKQFTFQPPIF